MSISDSSNFAEQFSQLNTLGLIFAVKHKILGMRIIEWSEINLWPPFRYNAFNLSCFAGKGLVLAK